MLRWTATNQNATAAPSSEPAAPHAKAKPTYGVGWGFHIHQAEIIISIIQVLRWLDTEVTSALVCWKRMEFQYFRPTPRIDLPFEADTEVEADSDVVGNGGMPP